MSPREGADIMLGAAQQGWRGGAAAATGMGRRSVLNDGRNTEQLAKGAQPVGLDNFIDREGNDLAPAAAEDTPPPMVDIGPSHGLGDDADEDERRKSVLLTNPAADVTATADIAVQEAAIVAADPTLSHDLVDAAAKDPSLIDAECTALAAPPPLRDATAADCGFDAGGSPPVPVPVAQSTDLASAASTAATVLKRLASRATSSREVAGALEQAAQQLTSAFGAAGTTSYSEGLEAATTVSATVLPPPPYGNDKSGEDDGSSGSRSTAILTQTASGRVAKIPSACLELRPHTGRPGGTQRLLAAALATVGSLAKAASSAAGRSPAGAGPGAGLQAEAALTSAASALDRAMEEIGAAAADLASTAPPEQEGPGLCGTGAEKFPAAFPSRVSAPEATTAARDPAALVAVYSNVQRSYAIALSGSPQGAATWPLRLGNGGRQDEQYGGGDNDTVAAIPEAALDTEVVTDIPTCADRLPPPGFNLVLNATSAAIAPAGKEPDTDTTINTEAVEDAGPIGLYGAYVYDKPDAPPPGVKPVAAVSGFAGAADWAWEDPEVESPAAPSGGGLVPDSADAVHDAEVAAAAAAMPSVIRDADDPATSPPGAAAAALYDHRTGIINASGKNRSDDYAAFSTTADPATIAVARLPPVPADLDAAAREALGPYGLERTAQATAAAVATIAPPRYVTPFPPRLLDILREPSARDLAGDLNCPPQL